MSLKLIKEAVEKVAGFSDIVSKIKSGLAKVTPAPKFNKKLSPYKITATLGKGTTVSQLKEAKDKIRSSFLEGHHKMHGKDTPFPGMRLNVDIQQ
jgi:hypothetical protein